tara:strand:+ start:434 stop:742 length:309 start_codon:yes stop_codon:yes gene_type:complete
MSTSNNPEDTIYIEEMECLPIDESTGKVKDPTNEESRESRKRIFGGGDADANNFSLFGTSQRGSLSMDFFYGIVIIGFIYSVGDYIFNGMPQGIVAKKLQHA